MRLLATILLTWVLLAWAGPVRRAMAEDPPPPPAPPAGDESGAQDTTAPAEPPADQPPAEPPADQPPPDQPPADEEKGKDEEEAPPPEVRRNRPETAEQEREYQRIKVLEDPFLTDPPPVGPPPDVGSFYNPVNSLRLTVTPSVGRYIVQNTQGAVVGYLTVSVSVKSTSALGSYVYLAQYADYGDPHTTELWLFGDTLKPRKLLTTWQSAPQPPPEDAAPGWEHDIERGQRVLAVDYLFDRVSVLNNADQVSSARQIRQLPFSFDREQLLFLVRQLNFHDLDWPFEAAVTDATKVVNLPLMIAKPERVTILDAAAEEVECFALTGQLGGETVQWWVERLPPYRLVKFLSGEYTYTLFEYQDSP